MKRPLLLLFICLFFPLLLHAQDLLTLPEINAERLRLNRDGMLVLGAWGIGNMGVSGWRMTQTKGTEKYFHQMNVFWNVVNLGLAAGGYFSAIGADPNSFSATQTVNEYHKLEKILLFNAGLDVGYVMTGFFLRERARNASDKWRPRLRGYGNSLLLQGGFLFAFDLAFYFLLHQQATDLLGPWQLSMSGTAMRVCYRF